MHYRVVRILLVNSSGVIGRAFVREDRPVGVVAWEQLADAQDFDPADAHKWLDHIPVVLGRLYDHREVRMGRLGRDLDLDLKGNGRLRVEEAIFSAVGQREARFL